MLKRTFSFLLILSVLLLTGTFFSTSTPSGFWLSGGSLNTNLQSSTYEWANFRSRACTFQTVYSTRDAGWSTFVATHGSLGQIADFTDPSITVMIQTAPFPSNTGSTYATLINGDYDSYWQQIGTQIKNRVDSGKPTIISIAWEMNGKPKFLLGISYYGALGAPKKFIKLDLDEMQSYGFNWIRVWATWRYDISAVDAAGSEKEALFYCSSATGKEGVKFKSQNLKFIRLALKDGTYTAEIFKPDKGVLNRREVEVKDGVVSIELPSFTDDIAVHLLKAK